MESWELVRFLHIVALALFVGGQIMLVVAIVPVLRGEPDNLMLSVARRFGIHSATGIAMASHYSRWEDDTLKAKLAVLVLVAVLTGLHIASPQSRALSFALAASSLLVVWLGVVLTH